MRLVHKLNLVTAAVLCALSTTAHADLRAKLHALPAYQVGTGEYFTHGVTFEAHTNLNTLWAGATFRVDCNDPKIRPSPSGSRGWSDNGILGPRNIIVTVPAVIPARTPLPGWNSVTGGTIFDCQYTYSGSAKTNIVPVGAGGVSVQIGGDLYEETATLSFSMLKPGTVFGGGCIQ